VIKQVGGVFRCFPDDPGSLRRDNLLMLSSSPVFPRGRRDRVIRTPVVISEECLNFAHLTREDYDRKACEEVRKKIA
jgi:hypothetical protein